MRMSLSRVGAHNREIVSAAGHHRVDVIKKRVRHKRKMHPVIDNPDRLGVDGVIAIRLEPKAIAARKFGYSIAGVGAAMPDTVSQEVSRSLARGAIEAGQGYEFDRVTFAMSTGRGQDLPGISIGIEI